MTLIAESGGKTAMRRAQLQMCRTGRKRLSNGRNRRRRQTRMRKHTRKHRKLPTVLVAARAVGEAIAVIKIAYIIYAYICPLVVYKQGTSPTTR